MYAMPVHVASPQAVRAANAIGTGVGPAYGRHQWASQLGF